MIAEKAADMIKEDWNEAYDENSTCGTTYSTAYPTYKNAEDDTEEKSTNKTPPDVFNETSSLFPNLPKDHRTQPEEINNNTVHKTQARTIEDDEDDEAVKESLPIPIAGDTPYGIDVNKPPDDDRTYGNFYQLINPQLVSYIPPSYVPPYPYLAHDRYNLQLPRLNRPSSLFQRNPFQKPSLFNNNLFNNNLFSDKKQPNPNVFSSPRIPSTNLGTPYGFQSDDKPIYYETNEVITPKGERRCRVWLYYDGMKYEVVL